MARTCNKNQASVTDKDKAARFQEAVAVAMDHFECKHRDKLVRKLKELGMSGDPDFIVKQMERTSTPSDTVVRHFVQAMEKEGIKLNVGYILNGKGKGKGKQGKTLILEDNRAKIAAEQAASEEQNAENESLFSGMQETSLEDITGDDVKFDFPDDMEMNVDDINEAILEDEDLTPPAPDDEDLTPPAPDDEDLTPPAPDDEDLTPQTPQTPQTTQTSQTIEPSTEASSGSPAESTPDNAYDRIEQTIHDFTDGVNIEVPGGAKTAYEKWIEAARQAGITEIDPEGMSIKKNGLIYDFVPADDKEPYRQIVVQRTKNTYKNINYIPYHDDRVKWQLFVCADFHICLDVEAPTKEAAEAKLNDIIIKALANNKEMICDYSKAVAVNPKKSKK